VSLIVKLLNKFFFHPVLHCSYYI